MYCDECKDQAHAEKSNLQAETKAVERARDEIRKYAAKLEADLAAAHLHIEEMKRRPDLGHWSSTSLALKAAQKDLEEARLQIETLEKEVERLKGPFTCPHSPEFAGGACAACHAQALENLDLAHAAADGAEKELEESNRLNDEYRKALKRIASIEDCQTLGAAMKVAEEAIADNRKHDSEECSVIIGHDGPCRPYSEKRVHEHRWASMPLKKLKCYDCGEVRDSI